MFKRNRYRQPDTTFDATGPLPGAEEQFKERAVASIQSVRANILQASLYGAITFGVVTLLSTLPNRLQNKQYVLIGIFSAALLASFIITFYRKASYRVRVTTFITLLVLLSVSTMYTDGLYGNGRMFLITVPIMSVLLLDSRRGFIALVASLAFVALAGFLMTQGIIEPPSMPDANSSVNLWFVAFSTMVLVVATTTLSLNAMIAGLQRSINAEQRLRAELDEERSALERRIQERTGDLERRLVQLRTAGEITNALGAVLDPQALLQQVVDLVQQRFELYYVGVFLVDERSENAVLRAGSGESGKAMLEQTHHLPLDGTSMISWCINNGKARIALDVGSEAVRFSNPNLPLTRSELALPLIKAESAGETATPIGALTVQSNRPQAFDEDDIVILQSITNALGTALVNANLFQQVERNLLEIRSLNRQYLQQAWDRAADNIGEVGGVLKASAEDLVLLGALDASRQSSNDQILADGETGAEPTGSVLAAGAAPPITVKIPLAVRDHQFGTIQLDALAAEPGQTNLDPDDMAFVEVIAQEAAQALENIRLLEETQGRARREQAINSFMGNLSSTLDLNSLLQSAARQLGLLPNVRQASIRLGVSGSANEGRIEEPTPPAPAPGNGSSAEEELQ